MSERTTPPPRRERAKPHSVRLTDTLWKALASAAQHQGTTPTAALRTMVERYVRRHSPRASTAPALQSGLQGAVQSTEE